MPFYDFTDPTGQQHEVFFSMKDAPPIGSTIERDGVKLTRLPEPTRLQPIWKPYVSMKGGAFLPGADGHDSQGRSIIGSQKTEREWMAANDRQRD